MVTEANSVTTTAVHGAATVRTKGIQWLTRGVAHCGGEEAARLELLQAHGAGVGPEEQDAGHEGDVRHEATGLSDQLPFVFQTLLRGQGRPGGVRCLQTQDVPFTNKKQYLEKAGELSHGFCWKSRNVTKTRTLHTTSETFVQAVTLGNSDELPG